MNIATPVDSAAAIVHCDNLEAAIDHYTGALGYRLDMIMPADNPRVAIVSGHGHSVRLEVEQPATQAPADPPALLITRASAADAWVVGRAGMQYRDLIPGRLGGRYIASHIRIPDGGPVPDYVHYHQVRFQMIYCLRGWVRVVYEDQGPPFVLHAGDCVLQPPTIRHRVLEASPGLEVIEVGGPSEHATFREHEIGLPTAGLQTDRRYGQQRFVRHIAADADWHCASHAGFRFRDTGIADATDGLACVRVLRAEPEAPPAAAGAHPPQRIQEDALLFWQVLDGQCQLISDALGTHTLLAGDACVIPTGAPYALAASGACQLLEVSISIARDETGMASPEAGNSEHVRS